MMKMGRKITLSAMRIHLELRQLLIVQIYLSLELFVLVIWTGKRERHP